MGFLKILFFIGLLFSGLLTIFGIAMIADGELGGGLAVLLIFGALFFIFLKSISTVDSSISKNKKQNSSDEYLEADRLLEEYRNALDNNKNNNQSELDELKRRIQSLERDNEILTFREIQRIEKENKSASGWTFFKWIFIVPLLLGLLWIAIQMELGIW